METWQKHEIRPHQGAGPPPDPLPTEPLPARDNSGADSRDVEEYVLRMRRIRDREAGRVVDEPPAPVSIVGTVVTRQETGKNSVLPDGPNKAKSSGEGEEEMSIVPTPPNWTLFLAVLVVLGLMFLMVAGIWYS